MKIGILKKVSVLIVLLLCFIITLTSFSGNVLSSSLDLSNINTSVTENPVEGFGIEKDNLLSSIPNTETSTIPQLERKTVYSDFNTFSLCSNDCWVPAGRVDIYDFEGKINDPENKDAQFFVYLSTQGHKDGLWEEIQNTIVPGYKSAKPMKTVEAGDIVHYYYEFVKYSQINTDEDYKKYANYHVIAKEKVDDSYRIYNYDDSVKYYGKEIYSKNELEKHFSIFTDEYIAECVEIYYELQEQIKLAYYNVHKRYFDEIDINVMYDYSALFGGTWAGYFTYLTLEDIEMLKELPFGINLHLMPKFVETHFANGTLIHDSTIIYKK